MGRSDGRRNCDSWDLPKTGQVDRILPGWESNDCWATGWAAGLEGWRAQRYFHLALAAKGLVIARRGKYLEDDHVFLNTNLAKLLPDLAPEELPTMTLGVDERFRSFVEQ